METEATTADAGPKGFSGVSGEDVMFGTRPSTDRPHSLSLASASQTPAAVSVLSSGLDVLVGVGIGAVLMYYLDPDGGARRRARVRDSIAGGDTIIPEATGSRTLDALGATIALVGAALLARGLARVAAPAD